MKLKKQTISDKKLFLAKIEFNSKVIFRLNSENLRNFYFTFFKLENDYFRENSWKFTKFICTVNLVKFFRDFCTKMVSFCSVIGYFRFSELSLVIWWWNLVVLWSSSGEIRAIKSVVLTVRNGSSEFQSLDDFEMKFDEYNDILPKWIERSKSFSHQKFERKIKSKIFEKFEKISTHSTFKFFFQTKWK